MDGRDGGQVRAWLTMYGNRYLPAERVPASADQAVRYRESFSSPCVFLSLYDRSRDVLIEADRLTAVGGPVGYRSVRATHGIAAGSGYFEVLIRRPAAAAPAPHVRVGWARLTAPLDGPVGLDAHGYGICDGGGTVHGGNRSSAYTAESFAVGDVLGCEISLPAASPGEGPQARRVPRRRGFFVIGQREFIEEAIDREWPERRLGEASFVQFYKNGRPLGRAFANLPADEYYPTVSLYREARVTVNFGPVFHRPPGAGVRPMADQFNRRVIAGMISEAIDQALGRP